MDLNMATFTRSGRVRITPRNRANTQTARGADARIILLGAVDPIRELIVGRLTVKLAGKLVVNR